MLEIIKALERSVEEKLEDRVGIAFSGGLDSTTLAVLSKKHSEVFLFSAGTTTSQDLEYAEKLSHQLNLPLFKEVLEEERIMEIYEKIYSFYPSTLLKIEIGIPVYAVCERAKKEGIEVMLFGSGAEELFVGYDRYYRYLEEGRDLERILREEFRLLKDGDIAMIKKIAYKFNVEARFPFYSKELAELVFQIPLEERIVEKELKKGILREAGKIIGVPKLALERKKKAAQYGSGVHKVLMKHSEEINKKYPPKLIPKQMPPI